MRLTQNHLKILQVTKDNFPYFGALINLTNFPFFSKYNPASLSAFLKELKCLGFLELEDICGSVEFVRITSLGLEQLNPPLDPPDFGRYEPCLN